MSPITVQSYTLPPPDLVNLLVAHLPYSLPVLRRLQFAVKFPSFTTPHARILHAFSDTEKHFAVTYLDLSRAPETECWLYSTLQDFSSSLDTANVTTNLSESEASLCDDLVLAILGRARLLEPEVPKPRLAGSGRTVLGSLDEAVRLRLLAQGVRMTKTPAVADEIDWEFCGKWLFRVDELPDMSAAEHTWVWDVVRRGDIPLIQSRTHIPRQEATLLSLPSMVAKLGEKGTPIAWAFLGLDGTLMTLHVEELYRGRGLAKALACRLIRHHLKEYGDDGWGAADVFESNLKSQAVCKSISGKLSWTVSWAIVDLESVEPV